MLKIYSDSLFNFSRFLLVLFVKLLRLNKILACHLSMLLMATLVLSSNVNAQEKSDNFSVKLWQTISSEDKQVLRKINRSLKDKKYNEALNYSAELKKEKNIDGKSDFSEAAVNIILWKKFGEKIEADDISFSDISRFTSDNSFYPNIATLKRNVEKVAVANSIPYLANEQYFNMNPAGTTESKLYFLESKIEFLTTVKETDLVKDRMEKEIQGIISDIWLKENLSASEEKDFLKKYEKQLTQDDHINRIDRLLWDERITDAKRIMGFVDEDYQRLFLARVKISNAPKYINKVIRSVPRRLRNNEGLAYRKALWYKSRDQIDDLIDVMLDLPATLQYPEKWWGLRHLYAREMFKKKKYKISYALTKNHGLATNDSDFWEAEWISGWIALRFLNKPKDAYVHFDNLYQNVRQPVTLARATYWLAMASEAMGDKENAIKWYKAAAQYPIFFYGQLAIHKHRLLDPIGARDDIILPKNPRITGRDLAEVSESLAVKVAYLLTIMDNANEKEAGDIFEWAAQNANTGGEIYAIMKIVNELGNPQLSVRISRIASKKNIFFIKDKFLIVKEIANYENAPLIHAIVKQESGFAASALSHVGAVGFMQLMPDTAKLVAKDIGIRYNKKRLSSDIQYNVRLGSFYIKKLIDRFDGSEMLAIASYNAGPNAAQRWINEFYDPRKEKDLDKVVDWIELITYSETRNYVQRIMENLIVYKYLMSRENYDSVQ